MARNIQILLPLMCVVFAEDHADTERLQVEVSDQKVPLWSKRLSGSELNKQSASQPMTDDNYSYKRTYDHLDSYREHIDIYRNHNFNNRPSGTFIKASNQKEFSLPGSLLPNQDGNVNNHISFLQKFYETDNDNENNQRPENQYEESKLPVNEEKIEQTIAPLKDDPVHEDSFNSGKDYHVVDNNGNDVYISRENTPNGISSSNHLEGNSVIHVDIMSNNNNNLRHPYNRFRETIDSPPPANNVYISIAANIPGGDVSSNNQQIPNRVQHVPVINNNNQEQPISQNYQAVNGQAIPQNIPLTAYRQNDMPNLIHSNQPLNTYTPTSVLIYANGQLILVPGININPQQSIVPVHSGYQEGSNVLLIQNPNNNVYPNVPNYGHNSSIVQIPNTVAQTSNDSPKSGYITQNIQPVQNPSNLGFYYLANGPSNNNQGSVSNHQNQNPARINNNPIAQPAAEWSSNQNLFPKPEKGPNLVTQSNYIPTTERSVNIPKPVSQPVTINYGQNLLDRGGAPSDDIVFKPNERNVKPVLDTKDTVED